MPIAIQPYTEEWVPAVKAFNRRLAAGGVTPEFHFHETSTSPWLPKLDGRHIYQEFFLAVDRTEVHGAFILKFQDFYLNGETRNIPYYHLPISEGIVNKAYASVGVHMLRSALKAQPLLYCLGMGGLDRPLPQMLKALGWSLCEVPFAFHVNHPVNFLRQIAPLRQSKAIRFIANLAAITGAGWTGITLLQKRYASARLSDISIELVNGFDAWTDEVWEESKSHYAMVASRDRATLNILYPREKNFLRLKVSRSGQTVGWAVMLDTQMNDNKYFGDLRVGSIADCFAAPANAAAVMQGATEFLEARGVDLVVSNQLHADWITAMKSRGFLDGPSNFIFASSNALTNMIGPRQTNKSRLHFTRGDGDGPVNL
jgi:hypothetical protein